MQKEQLWMATGQYQTSGKQHLSWSQ